jgi:hypothetical protein
MQPYYLKGLQIGNKFVVNTIVVLFPGTESDECSDKCVRRVF